MNYLEVEAKVQVTPYPGDGRGLLQFASNTPAKEFCKRTAGEVRKATNPPQGKCPVQLPGILKLQVNIKKKSKFLSAAGWSFCHSTRATLAPSNTISCHYTTGNLRIPQ